ncbi:LysR family transcriptional regulator [Agrobacterium vitis]|uniref:LysR family transcriptional regulator n=1 Tax=Agrobacterium vitis TaxID=373 RepID=UPI002AC95307|nr:LysR family transcriptional regulator [Agrobacterium vitis]
MRALRMLESFLHSGSVTATARELNVSHSAVSHQLKQIEDWAGIRLVRREGRHAILTEAGESLSRVVNESFGAIRHELDRLTMREDLPISVAALRIVFPNWLLQTVHEFMATYPGHSVYLQEHLSDQPVLPEPDITIGFSLGGEIPEGASRIIPGRAIPVCSPAFLAHHPIRDNADIASSTLLQDEDMRMWRTWLEKVGIEWGLGATFGKCFVSGSALAVEAALAGLGIALCREALISPHLQSGALVTVSDVGIDDQSCYFLILSQRGESRLATVRLSDWLKQSVAKKFGPLCQSFPSA